MLDLLKKTYVSPKVELLNLAQDIITTSGPTPEPGEQDPMSDQSFEESLF